MRGMTTLRESSSGCSVITNNVTTAQHDHQTSLGQRTIQSALSLRRVTDNDTGWEGWWEAQAQ